MSSSHKLSPTPPSKRKHKHKDTMARECAVCLDEFSIWETTVIDSSPVCHGCLRELFTRAVQNEEDYPPKWGGKTLNIDNYLSMIPKELIRQYKQKEKEYQTPPKVRIYCTASDPDLMLDVGEVGEPCGAFVGRIAKDWREKHWAFRGCLAACPCCNTLYCLICGEERGFAHTCSNPGRPETDEDGLAGLVKGKDYQICPSETCGRKIELRDGCNSMKCTCGVKFCFICGEKNIQGDHFDGTQAEGACPRFGHPSERNAIWAGGPDVDPAGDVFEQMLDHMARQRQRRHRRRNEDPLADLFHDEANTAAANRGRYEERHRERMRMLDRLREENDALAAALGSAMNELPPPSPLRQVVRRDPPQLHGRGRNELNEARNRGEERHHRQMFPTPPAANQRGNFFDTGLYNPPNHRGQEYVLRPTSSSRNNESNVQRFEADRSFGPPTQRASSSANTRHPGSHEVRPATFIPPPAPYPRHLLPNEFSPIPSPQHTAPTAFRPPIEGVLLPAHFGGFRPEYPGFDERAPHRGPNGGFRPTPSGHQQPGPHRGPNGGFRPVLQNSHPYGQAAQNTYGAFNRGRPAFAAPAGPNNFPRPLPGDNIFGPDRIFDRNPGSNSNRQDDPFFDYILRTSNNPQPTNGGDVFAGMYPNGSFQEDVDFSDFYRSG